MCVLSSKQNKKIRRKSLNSSIQYSSRVMISINVSKTHTASSNNGCEAGCGLEVVASCNTVTHHLLCAASRCHPPENSIILEPFIACLTT